MVSKVARALLTTDSLKVLDKLGDRFGYGDTAQRRRKFSLAPDLSLSTSLVRMPIGLDAKEVQTSARIANTPPYKQEKRRFRRAARRDMSLDDTLADDRDMNRRRLERRRSAGPKKDAIVFQVLVGRDSIRVTRVLIK
ncbi:MAG: hypothetical protein IPP33_10590 [Flavobacteriales bacterium]|nr:hypothetical protein [Flavobacteriales bacterium]